MITVSSAIPLYLPTFPSHARESPKWQKHLTKSISAMIWESKTMENWRSGVPFWHVESCWLGRPAIVQQCMGSVDVHSLFFPIWAARPITVYCHGIVRWTPPAAITTDNCLLSFDKAQNKHDLVRIWTLFSKSRSPSIMETLPSRVRSRGQCFWNDLCTWTRESYWISSSFLSFLILWKKSPIYLPIWSVTYIQSYYHWNDISRLRFTTWSILYQPSG